MACLKPDPRPSTDALLDSAKLAGLIGFRRAATGSDEDTALAGLGKAAANLRHALKNIEEALADTLRRARPSRNWRGTRH